MKFISLLFCVVTFSLGLTAQYSNYYNINQNVNHSGSVTVNENIKVSAKIDKTVRTIDYGALAQANAQKESNRLAALQYSNERDKDAAIAIAADPAQAWNYGTDNSVLLQKKFAKSFGAKKPFYYRHKSPHSSLFIKIGNHPSYQNQSIDGVITEIELLFSGNIYSPDMEVYSKYNERTEDYIKEVKIGSLIVGEFNPDFGNFVHAVDIKKSRVFGHEGFIASIIYENDYELVIKDNYYAITNGLLYAACVKYRGDKNEIDFEQLEGRRHYLRRLCNKIIASAEIKNFTSKVY